ncbi:MAG: YceI family protein [Alphaproteobacteria bacterium]
MRRTTLSVALAALLLAAPAPLALADGHKASEQTVTGGKIKDLSTKPADVVAGTYKLDPTHVNVTWIVSHLGLSPYQGRFNDISGEMTIDPAKPAEASVAITIKTDSVDTLSDRLDEELKSDEGFNAAEYPEITFKSTKVEVMDGGQAKVTGDLTMLGKTKPVTLDVTLVGTGPHPFAKKQAVGFKATARFNRSEFGFTQWAPVIGDTVDLVIGAEFQKAD